MKIFNYIDLENILFLSEEKRDDALQTLVESLSASGKLKNKSDFFNAILEREKIVSTGIGMGVAIPHAKMEDYQDFFIAIGIQQQKGLEWNSLDHLPVKLIFMIGGPEDKQTQYLQILSKLTLVIRNEKLRKQIIYTNSSQEIIDLFKDY
ncbi:MAG: PTS sugar transporter subunit IIA [Chlamydiae bacterium CG10_big_fil_rev_8_21_14_0_10_35_9]|nr:MAG: PTS sugar transporter subunit IIA [Chlamydiae bacterium CG10_big_fil_rev_8_21_14_0_10_35_9]